MLVSRAMDRRSLVGIWRANVPHWVWIYLPVWVAVIIVGLDGGTPEWAAIFLFLAAAVVLVGITEVAGTYSDREEDWLYAPSNPLVTGDLGAATAKKVFLAENVLAGLLVLALLLVTHNYALVVAVVVGWFVGVSYSLPPLRLKETAVGPFWFGLGVAILPVVAWLSVEPSLTAKHGFILALAAFFLVCNLGHGVTQKLRKTFVALDSGEVKLEQGRSVYDLPTVGFKVKVKNAIALEAAASLGAFALVPVFWHLGIFDTALSVGLLTLPLALTMAAVGLRLKDPIKNRARSMRFMILAWAFIVASLLGAALATIVHWGIAVLVCVAVLGVFVLLFRSIHPMGGKALTAPWR